MLRIPDGWGTHLPMGRDHNGQTLPDALPPDTREETAQERAHWAKFLPPAGQTVAPFDAPAPVSKPRRPSRTQWVAALALASPVLARTDDYASRRPVPLCATTGKPRPGTFARIGRPAADWALSGQETGRNV